MMGMEKMVASMLGVTPEEVTDIATRMQEGVMNIGIVLGQISTKNDYILHNQKLIMDKMEIENGQFGDGNRDSDGNGNSDGNGDGNRERKQLTNGSGTSAGSDAPTAS